MVKFMNGYQAPMDRQFDEQPIDAMESQDDIEAPVIPISELGTTVADAVPGQNILTSMENAVRFGTKKIQLVIGGNPQGMSTLAGSYGKDIRTELKERAKAAGVEITGVELSPGRIAGLSGWNSQQGSIDEKKRLEDVQHVREAIKFAADVAGGGGVDVWSREFERDILDAEWNKDKQFYNYTQDEIDEGPSAANVVKYLVDTRTGQIIRDSAIRTDRTITRIKFRTAKDEGVVGKKDPKTGRVLKEKDYVDYEGNYVNPLDPEAVPRLMPKIDSKTKEFITENMGWDQLVEETERYKKENPKWKEISPEEYLYRQRLASQRAQVSGQALYWGRGVDEMQERLKELVDVKRTAEQIEKNMNDSEKREWVATQLLPQLEQESGGRIPEAIRSRLEKMNPSEVIGERITRQQNVMRGHQEQALSYAQNLAEVEEVWGSIKTPTQFAREKTFKSYGEAGLYAYEVTKQRKLDKPVYVGPELGWAGEGYGGHPQEFIDIIKNGRKVMEDELKKKGLSESAAKERAKQHIKGMVDTSHLTMWYKHFAKKKGESEDDHLKRFNKWAKNWSKKMVDEGVVGGVQIVDSITGDHAHLPPGQGMFDTKGIIHEMRNAGFKGPMVSEGHEEDSMQFGRNRILSETWRTFGSPISDSGRPTGLNTWGGIQASYFGHNSPTNYVVGGYAPSPEWQLWSETPFE